MKTLPSSSFHKPFQYKQKCLSEGICPRTHTPLTVSPPRYPKTIPHIKTKQIKSNPKKNTPKSLQAYIFYKCKMSDYCMATKHVLVS